MRRDWLVALNAALALYTALPGAASVPASAASRPGAMRFRAMSPRDSDEVERALDAAKRCELDDRGQKLRAEVAARFGVDFGAFPRPFVLELRPESDALGGAAGGEAIGAGEDGPAWFCEESDWELSGDIHELCESFLHNATVRCCSCGRACAARCPCSAAPHRDR